MHTEVLVLGLETTLTPNLLPHGVCFYRPAGVKQPRVRARSMPLALAGNSVGGGLGHTLARSAFGGRWNEDCLCERRSVGNKQFVFGPGRLLPCLVGASYQKTARTSVRDFVSVFVHGDVAMSRRCILEGTEGAGPTGEQSPHARTFFQWFPMCF